MRRINCEKYPCHFPEQDCTLCFCPFYPCLEERTGGKSWNGTWSCQGCEIIHRKDISEMVMDALMQGEEIMRAWKRLEERL